MMLNILNACQLSELLETWIVGSVRSAWQDPRRPFGNVHWAMGPGRPRKEHAAGVGSNVSSISTTSAPLAYCSQPSS